VVASIVAPAAPRHAVCPRRTISQHQLASPHAANAPAHAMVRRNSAGGAAGSGCNAAKSRSAAGKSALRHAASASSNANALAGSQHHAAGFGARRQATYKPAAARAVSANDVTNDQRLCGITLRPGPRMIGTAPGTPRFHANAASANTPRNAACRRRLRHGSRSASGASANVAKRPA
jgi:hypothetical protein